MKGGKNWEYFLDCYMGNMWIFAIKYKRLIAMLYFTINKLANIYKAIYCIPIPSTFRAIGTVFHVGTLENR